jgi:hypothetical protein
VPEWHTGALPATFLYAADAKNEPPLSIRLTSRMKILRPRFAPFRLGPQAARRSFAEHDVPRAPQLATRNFE